MAICLKLMNVDGFRVQADVFLAPQIEGALKRFQLDMVSSLAVLSHAVHTQARACAHKHAHPDKLFNVICSLLTRL